MIKPKGLNEILEEDPSLKEKMSYDEFEQKNMAGGSDIPMKDAYESYRAVCEE